MLSCVRRVSKMAFYPLLRKEATDNIVYIIGKRPYANLTAGNCSIEKRIGPQCQWLLERAPKRWNLTKYKSFNGAKLDFTGKDFLQSTPSTPVDFVFCSIADTNYRLQLTVLLDYMQTKRSFWAHSDPKLVLVIPEKIHRLVIQKKKPFRRVSYLVGALTNVESDIQLPAEAVFPSAVTSAVVLSSKRTDIDFALLNHFLKYLTGTVSIHESLARSAPGAALDLKKSKIPNNRHTHQLSIETLMDIYNEWRLFPSVKWVQIKQ